MREPATSRNVDLSLYSNGTIQGRIRVHVFHFNDEMKLMRANEYRYVGEASLHRLQRALYLEPGLLPSRPKNVELTMGFGSVNHLSVEVWIEGRMQ